jgi:hypothetical protein
MADIFTEVGEAYISDLVEGAVSPPADYFIGWGTGGGTAAKGDTALFTEASEDRKEATTSQPTANENRFVATLVADGSKTITNAGVFDAATTGKLLFKSDFSGIALELNDSITFEFTVEWT